MLPLFGRDGAMARAASRAQLDQEDPEEVRRREEAARKAAQAEIAQRQRQAAQAQAQGATVPPPPPQAPAMAPAMAPPQTAPQTAPPAPQAPAAPQAPMTRAMAPRGPMADAVAAPPPPPQQQQPQQPAPSRAFGPFASAISAAAAKHGVPEHLFSGLLAQESGFNPKAVGDNGASVGMGQFNVRGALADMGLTKEQVLAMGPEQQIDLAAQFYRQKIDQAGGDPIGGLKRYNGGGDPNYVQNVLGRIPGGAGPLAPAEQAASPQQAPSSPMANEMAVDKRMASRSPMANEMAADPNTLPDRQNPESGIPQNMDEWIYAEPEKRGYLERMDNAKHFAPITAAFGAGKMTEKERDQQVARRVQIAQAFQDLKQSGAAPADAWRRANDQYLYEQGSGEVKKIPGGYNMSGGGGSRRAGGVDKTMPSDGTNDLGVVGNRERQDRIRGAMSGLFDIVNVEQLVDDSYSTGASGAGFMEGRLPGRLWDDLVTGINPDSESAKQRSARNILQQKIPQMMIKMISQMPGQLSDSDRTYLLTAIPGPGSDRDEWDAYFQGSEDIAARTLHREGVVPTLAEAQEAVASNLREMRERFQSGKSSTKSRASSTGRSEQYFPEAEAEEDPDDFLP